MKIEHHWLAIDTSGNFSTVVVSTANGLHHRSHPVSQRKTHSILSLIDEVMKEAGLALSDLDGIGFTRGPGSFTGLRIAASVAQGLAYALHIPVIPFSTLQAIAESVSDSAIMEDRMMVVLDARRNQVFLGVYERDPVTGTMRSVIPDQLTTPECLAAYVTKNTKGIGSGFALYRNLIEQQVGYSVSCLSDASPIFPAALLKLTEICYRQGLPKVAHQAVPVYLQEPL